MSTSVAVGRVSRGFAGYVLAVVVALAPAVASLASGGYFSSSWGWSALGFGWLAAMGLAVQATALPKAWAVLGAFTLFLAWTFASSAWAVDVTSADAAGERLLVPVLALLAFLVVRRSSLEVALVALVLGAGAVCAYALATRLFADHFGAANSVAGYRLSRPIGYWNGLGIYAVIGLALAIGLLAHAERRARVLVALPIPIFAVTAYFTYSRGAAVAFAIALLVIFALDSDRTSWFARTAVVAVIAGVGVVAASQAPALTTAGMSLHRTVYEGHRLAVLIVVLCVACAAEAWIRRRAFMLPLRTERSATVAISLAAAAVIAYGVVAVGGPTGLWRKFEAPPPAAAGTLNNRLFSFSGNDRVPLWTQALHEYEAHPILGGGAGSYETYYLQHRTTADKVKNAHSLYLETLAELGPIGLALLLLALLAPLFAIRRARHNPVVPALAGAYVAFLAHMAVDWDWQLTGVAITGLFCGAGILVAASPEDAKPMSNGVRRALLGVTVVAIAASFVILVGNLYLSRASSAASAGKWAASARDAKRAHTGVPWSSEPLRLLGEAQLGLDEQQQAIATFHRAIAKSPDDWNLWFDLARATLGPARQQALAHASRLDPKSPEIAELRREIAAQKPISVSSPNG